MCLDCVIYLLKKKTPLIAGILLFVYRDPEPCHLLAIIKSYFIVLQIPDRASRHFNKTLQRTITSVVQKETIVQLLYLYSALSRCSPLYISIHYMFGRLVALIKHVLR